MSSLTFWLLSFVTGMLVLAGATYIPRWIGYLIHRNDKHIYASEYWTYGAIAIVTWGAVAFIVTLVGALIVSIFML